MNLCPVSEVEGAVSKRLERLERQLRMQRILTSGAAIAVVLLATVGSPLAQAGKTIEERVSELEKRVGGMLPSGGATRFTAPFEVVDKAGKRVLAIDEAGEVVVGNELAGGLRMGVGKSGAGFLSVREATGHPGITLGRMNQGPLGLRLLAGSEIRASFEIDTRNEARLKIGRPEGGGVEAGVGATGTGFLTVQRETGDMGVVIGRYRRDYLGVEVLNESLEPAASMFADKLGGKVQVRNPQGVAVGGLFAEEEGGGLALTGPAGGNTVVDLGVLFGGGSVQVYPVGGGTAKAGINAMPTGGGVHAYGNDGNAVASLISKPGGSGLLEISNGSTPVVQAGATVDGVGLVRTGPAFGGPTGVLTVPFQIIGHKAR